MGRLYQKTVSGDTVHAHFESGRVRSGKDTADTLINYNSIGQIYHRLPDGGDYIIANCDTDGNIRKGSGVHSSAVAICKDGLIFEGNQPGGRQLALFDGDMYGAAAAFAVVILKLGINK